jgi:hypothetical protein
LKKKLDVQTVKVHGLECEIECLKQKNNSMLDYANQKINEMNVHHRYIEINNKVYKDIRAYLNDKEINAENRVLLVLFS